MRELKVNEGISLNEVVCLRPCDAINRYRLGATTLFEIGEQIGAVVIIGKRKLLYRPKMDEYFSKNAQ